MKKTYVTSMPNRIGAFLKASRCLFGLGINITRVSYNKAVDSHTLFIEAEGSEEQLKKADAELGKIGYLQNDREKASVVLIEFCLKDVPGSVTGILELIDEFDFNISYLSSQQNGGEYQLFKMGLYVGDFEKFSRFIDEAAKLCRVRLIDYNGSKSIYDNSIFYSTYVEGLSKMLDLPEDNKGKLLVNVNLAMQTLDEIGQSPHSTFDSISKFAELLAASKGEGFLPRISVHQAAKDTTVTVIEPPCGSNTMIIKSRGKALFVDSGYACYREEMLSLLKEMLLPEFDGIKKTILVTHADVDHCGLLPIFDEIIASRKTAYCLRNEFEQKNGFREENPLHRPYVAICKILTEYRAPNPEKLTVPWENCESFDGPLCKIGEFGFEELNFEVFEGKGGHLPGEIVLIDRANRIAFAGDIYINIHNLTKRQAEYNRYAPILMTSVDTDPKLCRDERNAFFELLGGGKWQIFGAHGYKKDYEADLD